jgi:hypothetical protein
MNLTLFNANADNFPWGWVFLGGLIWLAVLARILSRQDYDTLTKILWVIVVIFVPIFGVLLYAFLGPDGPSKPYRIIPGSDVSGTPWADDPNHTRDS